MEITVEMASKTSREYSGRVKWGVHPKGAPKDYWVDIYVQDRPKPGQVFNLGAVKETQSADGAKTFREAEIIGLASGNGWPAPEPPQQAQPMQVHQPRAPAPTVQPAPSNGKIKWEDWDQMARVARDLGSLMDLEGDARAAFINTTMIAFSNGKLELPTEAGPVSRKPGDDGDAYANPDAVTPWATATP